mmetsp:Transcript_99618/g.171550  ORF Transcript_99618/g.171550 Transcript_99618/m.171550 type:complete len:206 (-) Transcript_99618:276-893(-)
MSRMGSQMGRSVIRTCTTLEWHTFSNSGNSCPVRLVATSSKISSISAGASETQMASSESCTSDKSSKLTSRLCRPSFTIWVMRLRYRLTWPSCAVVRNCWKRDATPRRTLSLTIHSLRGPFTSAMSTTSSCIASSSSAKSNWFSPHRPASSSSSSSSAGTSGAGRRRGGDCVSDSGTSAASEPEPSSSLASRCPARNRFRVLLSS